MADSPSRSEVFDGFRTVSERFDNLEEVLTGSFVANADQNLWLWSLGSTQSIPSGVWTPVEFGSRILFGTLSASFSPGGGTECTVADTGIYNLIVEVDWEASAAGVRRLRIVQDGLVIASDDEPALNISEQGHQCSVQPGVGAAGAPVPTVIRADVFQDSGGPLNVMENFASPGFMLGKMVGLEN
jgi:hypothetical protein